MNAVEQVKKICKERKIPISKLESDLGFGNAYISGLKKGVFPNDRLEKIAKYLDVPESFITKGDIDKRAKTDAILSKISDETKEYALKLNELSPEKKECVMKLIDLLK